MQNEAWQHAKELVVEALALPREERTAFLAEATGDDTELRTLVEELVASHEEADEFLAAPTAGHSTLLLGPGDASGLPAAGARIGPYKLLQEIGSGGFGVVFMAEQEEPVRRQVALKVIKLGMDTQETIARFEAERQALALMDHPNIARVLDAGATDTGRPYFVMELVKGVPVTEYCNASAASPRERLEIVRQVCRAVQHAHQKGVIHRDIKPSNVLVTLHDGRPVPKVIDFGIAKAIDQRLTEKTLFTHYGQLVGTPQYMSPEQAEMSGLDIDTRSDVYSLGVLLYELLTGTTPFDVRRLREAGFQGMQRMIREEDPPRPSTRLSTLGDALPVVARQRQCDARSLQRLVRGELDWIVMKALERDRTRRYDTANALADDLARYLADEPVLANPPSFTYALTKGLRRHRGAVTALTLVLLGLAVGLVWALVEKGRAGRSAQLAAARYGEIIRLADLHRVEEYRAAARDLWPATPERVPDLRAWLDHAEPLATRLTQHENALTSLRDQGSAGPGGRWHFPDAAAQWQHDNLAALVEQLRAFNDPDPRHGPLASVRERWEFARSITERSVLEKRVAQAWQEAIADIASLPAYGGLTLTPQVGLVPLGRNPHSGLWEFVHLRSGTAPSANPYPEHSSPWQITGDTGIVLVLIPGGSFRMGAQQRHPEQPNFDLNAIQGRETPVHEVHLDAFFISKYEMTQAQWQRLDGSNPSRSPAGSQLRGQPAEITLAHPVENMDWLRCQSVLRKANLELPTEAQWEYAARAGTTTPWWCGSWSTTIEPACAGNLADASYDEGFLLVTTLKGADGARPRPAGLDVARVEPWRDGWAVHAPVGSLAPNPFGLHDVIGNVSEWCLDAFERYARRASAGDGERQTISTGGIDERIYRGGSYRTRATQARSASRAHGPQQGVLGDRGLRPARRIAP